MQTFIPYPDAARSASVLDQKRLGKQRVETYQLILWLHGVQMWDWDHRIVVPRYPFGARYTHPAMKMWAGNERALANYQDAFCDEWTGRGYADTCKDKTRFVTELINLEPETAELPPWWGEEVIHMSHRSNLVWKDPAFYGPIFPDDTPEDVTDESQFWAYRWPDGRLPFVERKQHNYDRAVSVLGSHADILLRKQDEFGWNDDHPNVLSFRMTFADNL